MLDFLEVNQNYVKEIFPKINIPFPIKKIIAFTKENNPISIIIYSEDSRTQLVINFPKPFNQTL